MEADPPKWRLKLRLYLLRYRPLEPRRKIKRYLEYGDLFSSLGEKDLARRCYETSKKMAEQTGAVHLLKKAEKRIS